MANHVRAQRVCVQPLLQLTGHAERLNQALTLGVSAQSVYRYLRHGIPNWRADDLAIRMNSHPMLLWPELYELDAVAHDGCSCDVCASLVVGDELLERAG